MNAVMGESELPLLKLYGRKPNESKGAWEYLDRSHVKYDTARIKEKMGEKLEDLKPYPVSGIQVIRSIQSGSSEGRRSDNIGYYSIKQYSLGWLEIEKPSKNETEIETEIRINKAEPVYLAVSLRTSGNMYFIEANETVNVNQVRSSCGYSNRK